MYMEDYDFGLQALEYIENPVLLVYQDHPRETTQRTIKTGLNEQVAFIYNRVPPLKTKCNLRFFPPGQF